MADSNFSERVQTLLNKISSTHPKAKVLASKLAQQSGNYFESAQNNCENMVGTVQVPVGLVGPLKIQGQHISGDFALPLATTEGCLVASVNRGAKAITQSGGTQVQSKLIGVTRAPVFVAPNLKALKEAQNWVMKNLETLKAATQETSRFLELIELTCHSKDNYLFIRFFFDPKDAMGMNMATIACDHLVKTLIEPNTQLRCLAISGNFCVDKKPSQSQIQPGRGFKVNASAQIPESILKEVLNTTSEQILESYHAKIEVGSELAGSLGKNGHIANIIAALFLATGQDIAHTVEASHGSTHISKENNGIRISIEIPSLLCGVVGGGTGLSKQKTALQLMGIEVDLNQPGKASKSFAELCAAAVLAGELSLLAALSSRELTSAHKNKRKTTVHPNNESTSNKVGIISYGVAIPSFRIKTESIEAAHHDELKGIAQRLGIYEKTVASEDEDSVTLALEAAQRAFEATSKSSDPEKMQHKIGALFMGSESHPYAVKSSGSIIGQALRIPPNYFSADLEFACKAGTTALQIVSAFIKGGDIQAGLAIGADTAQAKPGDALEYTAASGAAAFILGNQTEKIIATLDATTTYISDTTDFWRGHGQAFPKHGESFTGEPAYFKHIKEATTALLQKTETQISDYDHVVFHMPNAKFPKRMAQRLGVSAQQLEAGFVVPELGNSYAACSLLGLAAVLDQAQAGEKILLTSYGSGAGADSFAFTVTENIQQHQPSKTVKELIANKHFVDYASYKKMRNKH